jgi:flagellar biosynthesis regulator FlbT
MKVKEHFAKMALDLIGCEKAKEIIDHICKVNRIPRNVARGHFEELKRCKYIKVNDKDVVNIKQVPYE